MPRPKRIGITDPSVQLAAMRACRDAMIPVLTKAKIGSPEYFCAGKVIEAIDDLAGTLTGDRRVLWPVR